MASLQDDFNMREEASGLQNLLNTVVEHRPDADLAKIRLAYQVAEKAHNLQPRESGEPYITHPLAVATIVAKLRMDDDSIVAALLHDVLEDCDSVEPQFVVERFGQNVLHLVDGLTKLKLKEKPAGSAREQAMAETHRAAESLLKMLLAMAKDMRVMVIKLADRLHNMRTLQALAPERRTRIAKETLDIYAPLAARLGIWDIKWELEDLAFMYLHPKEFSEISELVAKSRIERESELNEAIVQLKHHLEQRGLSKVEIQGRPKHLYSIFNKIVQHGFHFEEIRDLLAVRIIVPSVADCYLALGFVHEFWLPMAGLFSDYIATPKPNGYRSLHTKVLGPRGDPLEVQIRTFEMHQVADYGVAAHWTYKDEAPMPRADRMKLSALREQLFNWTSDASTSSDVLRNLSTDLFSEQVFVFTPKGDVLDLPKDSCPIDFAFRVHTGLGLTTVGAKVNGTLVPLSTKLRNGDVIELITRSNAQPSLDWLEFVKSPHTRSKVRAWFRKRNRLENAARAKEAIERELRSLGIDPKELVGEDKLDAVAATIHDCENATDLLAKVGSGLMSVQSVVAKLRGIAPAKQSSSVIVVNKTKEGGVHLVLDGIESILLRRSKCCDPIPGDEVVAYVTRGRGMMIHRKICPNAQSFLELEPDRLIGMEWPPEDSLYSVRLKIVTMNRQGLLMDISTIFGESKTNVSAGNIRTLANQTCEIDVTIDVSDTRHLAQVMQKISNYSDVISILRVLGRSSSK